MRGNPRKGAGWTATGLMAGAWLASGTGLVAAEELPTLPGSVWAQSLPATPPDPRVAAAPPMNTPPPMVAPGRPAVPSTVPPPIDAPTPPPTLVPPPAIPDSPTPAPCDGSCPPPKSVWDGVPPVHPVPRLGNYFILPSGCGHYTALDAVLDHTTQAPKYPIPPNGAMAGSFFDADYRYLDKPDNKQHDPFDALKRVHLGCDWLFTTGGEFRFRYMDEVNSRFTGANNQYDLLRTRVYTDMWYRDQVRLYAEFIDADSWHEDLVPLAIDANRADILNLFVDLKVAEIGGRPVYVRGGRQELLYGSERLISPLDWANTRRTFQGVKAFYQGENLDVDAFWVKPVTAQPTHFDSVDDALNFTGVWATYRPRKGRTMDFYALNLDRSDPAAPNQPQVPGAANVLAPQHFNITTLGTRDTGDICGRFTWDAESMVQFGSRGNKDLFAYAYTSGVGYRFADAPWTPHLWLYYDYASGDADANLDGSYNTFNQLFPFGHYYLGFVDQVGRQNIQDLNLHLNYFPAKWITGIVQYHRFWLAEPEDALYNAGGRIVRQDPTGRAGRDVGQEIDFLWNFHLTGHQDLLVGYSKLFAGEFIRRTGNPDSPELLYVQYTYRW